MEKARDNKPKGTTQTKTNGGGTQVITERQQQQKQQQKQTQQKQNKPNNKGNKQAQNKKMKGGVRLDGEVDDVLHIQNEQNQKWQCQKCKYVNDASSTECYKCTHLARLAQQQNEIQEKIDQ